MFTEISPRYIEILSFENFSSRQLLILLIETVKRLNWSIGPICERGFLAYIKQSTNSPYGEIRVEIAGTNVNLEIRSGIRKSDEEQNKENIKILFATCMELKYTITPHELDRIYEELRPNFVSYELSFLNQPPSTAREDIVGFIGIFKPRNDYLVTPVLIDLNIAVFVIMMISGVNVLHPDGTSLIKWGANYTPLSLKGEWWRLVSSCFLHGGIAHIFGNMFALFYIGLLLEPHLGKIRFIAAYLLTGVAASVTSLWWHDKVISVGASGAIFGMYGVFLAMLTTDLIEKSSRGALMTSIAIFVIFNLAGGMSYGIDNAAHVGGLISGVIIGYAYLPGLKHKTQQI
ncbi:MAG: rhomboid family intramembrane serine protease [Segetibacter sp.]